MYFLKRPFAAVKILCSSINRIRLILTSLFMQKQSNFTEVRISAGDFYLIQHFLLWITFVWFQAGLCKFVKLNLLWRSRGGFQFRWLRPCFLIQESFRLRYLRVHKNDEVKFVRSSEPAPSILIKISTRIQPKRKLVYWSFNYHFSKK